MRLHCRSFHEHFLLTFFTRCASCSSRFLVVRCRRRCSRRYFTDQTRNNSQATSFQSFRQTIRADIQSNHCQLHSLVTVSFSLSLCVEQKTRFGPGAIGKLFVESLDPSSGSYTNNPPIFELNLSLASEHEILVTSSHQVGIRCVSMFVFNQVEMSNHSSALFISDRYDENPCERMIIVCQQRDAKLYR